MTEASRAKPMNVTSVQRMCKQVVTRAQLRKKASMHTLRMAYAYYYTFQRRAYFQGNSPWSGDVLGSWRP